MSLRDVPEAKLLQVAVWLDRFPSPTKDQRDEDLEEYWRHLLVELKRLPGSKFTYSRTQKVNFGVAVERDESPSIEVLHDLQKKGLLLIDFKYCLERIGCQGALNEFLPATKPEITIQPQSHTLHEGDTLQLECWATCKPGPPVYLWLRLSDEENSVWTPIIGANTNRLVIEDVHTAHTGFYTCRATNPRINNVPQSFMFTENVRVDVEKIVVHQKTPIRQATEIEDGPVGTPPEFPMITRQPKSVRVEYGGPVTLSCQARGSGIIYDWFHNGIYRKASDTTGTLVLKSVKQQDSGQYYCKATNTQGGSVESKTVIITVDPVIVIDSQPPDDYRGEWNTDIKLECSARSPKGKQLVYQWIKDKKKVISGAVSKVYRGKLKCRRDSNTYCLECRVSLKENPNISLTSCVTRVHVDCVRITRQPESVRGYIDEPLSLYCQAELIAPTSSSVDESFDEKIDYIWLKSDKAGGKKDPVLLQGQKVKQSGGRLVFEQLQPLVHAGHYVCQACLHGQWVESNEVQVSVAMPGEAHVDISQQPVTWVVGLGGQFRMECQAEVSPPQTLHYQWLYNSTIIPGETRSELERENVTEAQYGAYSCEVRTDSSSMVLSHSAYLTRPDPDETEVTRSLGTNMQQNEAEQILSTLDKERYAREKVALLIGNQHYGSPALNNLSHTEDEIRRVADKLRQLDFKVFTFVNLRFDEMQKTIIWFCGLLSAGVYGLFYYSGHGFNCNNIVYLMPVDSPEGTPHQPRCVGTDWITSKMQSTHCRAIVMLDCCQVFTDDEVQSGPSSIPHKSPNLANILVMYSCPAGQIAYEGSPFSTAFIEALDKMNLSLNGVFQYILNKMSSDMYGTRPKHSGGMKDDKITFHDKIMRDDVKRLDDVEKVYDQWQKTQSLPDTVTLADSQLGSLSDMLSVRLRFRTDFTNVLTILVDMSPKQDNLTVSLNLDADSLRDQGLEGVVDSENSLSFKITITNTQRLTKGLALPLVLSGSVPGQPEVTERIEYQLPELPVNALLKQHN